MPPSEAKPRSTGTTLTSKPPSRASITYTRRGAGSSVGGDFLTGPCPPTNRRGHTSTDAHRNAQLPNQSCRGTLNTPSATFAHTLEIRTGLSDILPLATSVLQGQCFAGLGQRVPLSLASPQNTLVWRATPYNTQTNQVNTGAQWLPLAGPRPANEPTLPPAYPLYKRFSRSHSCRTTHNTLWRLP